MKNPVNLFYTEDHEWLSSKGPKAQIGVSAHAIEQLGDIVHVELPSVGDEVSKGDSFGTIESTKTVSDLYAPCSGKVIAVNEDVLNDPESLSADPYTKGWLIEIAVESEFSENVMTAQQYNNYLENQV